MDPLYSRNFLQVHEQMYLQNNERDAQEAAELPWWSVRKVFLRTCIEERVKVLIKHRHNAAQEDNV